jgi:hypothetical protein
LFQNWIEKILRYRNYIICVIFKVKEPKFIFSKTYGIPLMFDVFFISVSILLMPPMTKKKEAIGLKLGSNRLKQHFEDQNEL